MKRVFIYIALAATLGACQNEGDDATPAPPTRQALYLDGSSTREVYVIPSQENEIKVLKAKLLQPSEEITAATIVVGDAQALTDYNAQYGTAYKLLPKTTYKIDDNVIFDRNDRESAINLTLEGVTFADENEVYALPLQLLGSKNLPVLNGQDRLLLIVRQEVRAKVLRMGTTDATKSGLLREKLPRWTLEFTVNLPTIADNTPLITINNTLSVGFMAQQLQVKWAERTLTISKERLQAAPNKWYALSVSYDSHTLRVYVNGKLLAQEQIKGEYLSLNQLTIAGSEQLIREVRFWQRALTPREVVDKLWHLQPAHSDLLFYLPLNGKKKEPYTKQVTDDETFLWDWSAYGGLNMPIPEGATFDNYRGMGYAFPNND